MRRLLRKRDGINSSERQSLKQVCEYMYIPYYWYMCLYMNLYICICIDTTNMPFTHSYAYFAPIEEFVTCCCSFPSQMSWWVKTTATKIFHKNCCVYIYGFVHTCMHMANTYTHTTLSLVLMQVGL